MALTIGLAAMVIGVAIGIVAMTVPRHSAPAAFTTFVQFATMAAIFGVGSTVMYLLRAHGGGQVTLVIADASMVLAPGTMGIAVSRLSPRPRAAAWGGLWTVAAGVALVSALADPGSSLVVKAAVLALVSGACAVAAARSTVVPRRHALIIAVATGAYAVFSAGRAIAGGVAGWGSAPASTFFAPDVSVAAGTVAVLACGTAVILALRPSARVSARGPSDLSVVVIGDAVLLAAAYGRERLRSLVSELRAAAHALDDRAVDVRHGVATALPAALSTLAVQMENAFGWGPEEIALLAEPTPRRREPA